MSRRSQVQNPFVGLRPFESEDSLYYFGRGDQIKALLRQLHQTRFLAVVGSSGCGKSSLVRAGLIPNLEAGFLVQDRDLWHIATMKPGDAPLLNLARALLSFLGESTEKKALETYTETIRCSGAQAVLKKILPTLDTRDANLLLLVDQFEELFRFQHESSDSGQEEAADFVSTLLRLVDQSEAPIFICLTMRADFLGDCDAFQGLPEAVNRSQYLVPRLTRQQRREAIAGPIHLAGARIAPRLLDRLLNENVGIRDDLPILQHALMRTWTQWASDDHDPIDMVHYEKIYTVKNALNDHADEALKDLDDGDRVIAKRLFQTLTETDAGNRRVRRPAHLSEIAAISGTKQEKLVEVIQKFREDDRNLLVLSSENPADDPLVDISHESFIRQWHTLSRWVDEETESRKIYRRLAESAELHATGHADFYHEADLQVALEWREERQPNEAWGSRYHPGFDAAMAFLDESRSALHKKAIEKEKARLEKEQLLKEKNKLLEQKTHQQKKTLSQARVFMAVLAVVLATAISASIFAGFQWRQAKSSAETAEKNAHEANYNLAKVFEEKALQVLEDAQKDNDVSEYKQAWLYTAAALKQEIGPGRMALSLKSTSELLAPETIKAAFAEKWFSSSVNSHSASVNSVAFSPDGKTLASGSSDNTIRLWNVASGNSLCELRGHSASVNSVAFSPDGNTLATGSSDSTIWLWDVASGNSLRELRGHATSVLIVTFSPDGKTLASGSSDNTIRLWNIASGENLRELKGHTDDVLSVAFSPDGKTLASGSGRGSIFSSGSSYNAIRLWNVASGKSLRELKGHADSVRSVAFSPDGKTLASGSSDNTIRLWNVASDKSLRELRGHTDSVRSVAFSPDGKTLASGSSDNTIRLWNVASGKNLHEFKGHAASVLSVAFSPDGKTLASGSSDNTIRLWDLASGKNLRTFKGHADSVWSVAFSPDGKTLASGSGNSNFIASDSDDNSIRLWDLASGKNLHEFKGHTDSVWSVAFSPDGKTLASGSSDKTIRLWDLASRKNLRTFKGHAKSVLSVAFSPDGKTLASGSGNNLSFGSSDDYTIRLWDLASGKNLRTFKGHTASVLSVTFSPDGKTLASGSGNFSIFGSSDYTIRLWDLTSGKNLREFKGHTASVWSVAFSPDGKTLASGSGNFFSLGSSDYTIRLWDLASGKSLCKFKGHTADVRSVAFSPDGKTLASGSFDNTIRLWDLTSEKNLREFKGYADSVRSVAFSPDGKTLASGSSNMYSSGSSYYNTILLWDLASGKILRTFKGHAQSVGSVAFNPDGKTLASGSNDNTVRLWDVTSGGSLRELKGHIAPINSVAFSPDGKTLASGSGNIISSDSSDNTIRLWDLASGKNLRTFKGHTASVLSVTFSPDGKTLASGSGNFSSSGSSDYTIRLWNVASGKSLRELRGHAAPVRSVAFSPDGKILASGSDDNTIRLWNVASGKSLRELKGHAASVRSVAFSPDGKILASGSGNSSFISLGSSDNTIRLWDLASGNSLREFKGHTASVWSLAFSPDGNTLASGSDDKTIKLWDIPFYFMFWKDGKSTALLNVFAEGVEFFWQVRRMELEFKRQVTPTLYPKEGYNFKYDPRFRPLLNPPAPGQGKFDQILEWAKGQLEKGK